MYIYLYTASCSHYKRKQKKRSWRPKWISFITCKKSIKERKLKAQRGALLFRIQADPICTTVSSLSQICLIKETYFAPQLPKKLEKHTISPTVIYSISPTVIYYLSYSYIFSADLLCPPVTKKTCGLTSLSKQPYVFRFV